VKKKQEKKSKERVEEKVQVEGDTETAKVN